MTGSGTITKSSSKKLFSNLFFSANLFLSAFFSANLSNSFLLKSICCSDIKSSSESYSKSKYKFIMFFIGSLISLKNLLLSIWLQVSCPGLFSKKTPASSIESKIFSVFL